VGRSVIAALPPVMGLGGAALGNLGTAMSDVEAADLLATAWDAGIRHFDTAPHYGLGLSERRLGRFLATKPRDQFVVSTKVGRLLRPVAGWQGEQDGEGFVVPGDFRREWDFTPDGIRTSLEESCDRLGLDAVDIVYLHDPERWDLAAAVTTGWPALVALREAGVVRAIGVGSMDTEALLAVASTGDADLLMVAGRYTLLDQSVVPEVVDVCSRTGTRMVAAAVFNSGLLADTTSPTTYDYGAVPADKLELARRIAAVCAAHGVDLPTAALHYPLRDKSVQSVIFGAAQPSQVRQNVDRLAQRIPPGLWSDLVEQGLVP
jgi:D-threo-aldose 1-dehydrogenase